MTWNESAWKTMLTRRTMTSFSPDRLRFAALLIVAFLATVSLVAPG